MAEGTQHPITDAGRRMSEAYALARQQGGEGRWLAVELATGTAVGPAGRPDVFDSRADAVRHADESRHALVMIGPMTMTSAEATAWIDLHRRTWAAGWKFTDPGGSTPIPDLGPMATQPRPGLRPSGLVIPDMAPRRESRRRR